MTLSAHADVQQARITEAGGVVDAAHSRLTECLIETTSLDRLDLTGSTLADVEFDRVRVTELRARAARWRSVRITGGRIGTLDLTDADLHGVELTGVRIDYLTLASAQVTDLLVVDCTIRSLDLPMAKLERVRFERSRADDVDNRGVRARNVDLRGLDALAYLDPAALRGTTLSDRQIAVLSPALAQALGIDVRD